MVSGERPAAGPAPLALSGDPLSRTEISTTAMLATAVTAAASSTCHRSSPRRRLLRVRVPTTTVCHHFAHQRMLRWSATLATAEGEPLKSLGSESCHRLATVAPIVPRAPSTDLLVARTGRASARGERMRRDLRLVSPYAC